MSNLYDHLIESLAKPDYLTRFRQNNYTALPSTEDEAYKQHGWYRMGRGIAGSVFGHPSAPYVVKVFRVNDTGYLHWLKFCDRNQNNSFVPKFRGKPVPLNQYFAAVRMERLRPASSREYSDFESAADSIWDVYIDPQNKDKKQRYTLPTTWKQSRQELLKCMAFIYSFEENDLHSGNLMVRSNGDYVITDPLAYQSKILPDKLDVATYLKTKLK